jgi:hypothetical protein
MSDDELLPEMRRAIHHLRHSVRPDPGAKARLLAAVRVDGAARRADRPWVRRRIGPALAAAAFAAAALAVVTVRSGPEGGEAAAPLASRPAAAGDPGVRGAARVHRVEVRVRDAGRVSLVGDFNGWDRRATPMEYDAARRRWVADVVLPPGRYAYALVLDDSLWITDPDAARTVPDELGIGRSILIIDSLGF